MDILSIEPPSLPARLQSLQLAGISRVIAPERLDLSSELATHDSIHEGGQAGMVSQVGRSEQPNRTGLPEEGESQA